MALKRESTGRAVAEHFHTTLVNASVGSLVLGFVVVTGVGFECLHDVGDDARSLRRGYMPNTN